VRWALLCWCWHTSAAWGASEQIAAEAEAIQNGYPDNLPQYPSVVALPGWMTGVLLSDRVVLAAGHGVEHFSAGCQTFVYKQPYPVSGLPSYFITVNPAGAQLGPCDPASGCQVVGVDGFAPHPGWSAANVDDCCGGDSAPTSCAMCMCCPDQSDTDPATCPRCSSPAGRQPLMANDIALLHLAEPVDLPRMRVLLRTKGPVNPEEGTFDLDPLTLSTGNVLGHIVGASVSTAHPDEWWRTFGPASIAGMSFTQENAVLGCSSSPPPDITCDGCFFHLNSASSQVLPSGGACLVPGDSGGPLVLNVPGGTPVGAGGLLPDERLVVGVASMAFPPKDPGDPPTECDVNGPGVDMCYVATYDFDSGDQNIGVTLNGSFILKHLHDWDQDGVWDDEDNCPVTPNGDQSNCNYDAEMEYNYPARGDVCDPRPCAYAELDPPDLQVATTSQSTFYTEVAGRAVKDRFSVFPVGSHDYGNGAHPGRPIPQVQVEETAPVPIYYRFCQEDLSVPIDCEEIDNKLLDKVPNIVSNPDPDAPYLPAHVEIDPQLQPTDSEQLFHPILSSQTVGVPRRWAYQDDFVSWVAAGWINDTSDCGLFGCGTNLDGRFWIHSDTDAGGFYHQVSSPVGGTTGYRRRNDGSVSGYELANHYFDLQPDAGYLVSEIYTVAEVPWFKWMVWEDAPVLDGWDGKLREDSFVVRLERNMVGVLRRDGRAIMIDDRVGGHLKSLMADESIVWAGAAEPRLNIGPAGVKGGFHALAFTADGTNIIDGVLRDGLQIGTSIDFERPVTARAGLPSQRTDFETVFSRSEDAAFVIAGRDLGTGEQLGDIWMRRVDGPGGWAKVPLSGYQVGEVLAATWSFVDHKLWVLDTTGAGTSCDPGTDGQMVRLVRVEPYLGAVSLVGQWPRGAYFRQQWLLVDQDGQVLLVSSSEAKGQHAVMRFEVVPFLWSAPVEVAWLEVRDGALAFEPLVDISGYTFARKTPEGIAIDRRSSLGGAEATLAEVEEFL